jgi:NhaB family Na+:H+ antiporter
LVASLAANFLGHSPTWYKRTIIAFLVLNPVLFAVNPYVAGWALVLEFILTLAMALRQRSQDFRQFHCSRIQELKANMPV